MNHIKEAWYETTIGMAVMAILALVITIVVYLFLVSLYAGSKAENANEHARDLELKNYKVSCDKTPWSCGCTITWDVDYGQQTEKFDCCGWGCE